MVIWFIANSVNGLFLMVYMVCAWQWFKWLNGLIWFICFYLILAVVILDL